MGREVTAQDSKNDAEPDGKNTYLLVSVSGVRCGIPASAIREVLHIPELHRPMGTPAIIQGMLQIGDGVVPVLRLDRLFNLPEFSFGLYSPVIILKNTRIALSVLVESVESLVEISQDQIRPVESDLTFNSCIQAQAFHGGEAVSLLRIDSILVEEEARILDEFIRWSTNRLALISPTERMEAR